MSDTTYNGWTNYETWCVNLWLDNDEPTYNEKRRIIRRASAKHEAMDALKDMVQEMTPDLGASFAADLLQAAIDSVNWHEIVSADWDELHDGDEEDEDDEA